MKFLRFSIIQIICCFLSTLSIKLKVPNDISPSTNEIKTLKTRETIQLFSKNDTSNANVEIPSNNVFTSNEKVTSNNAFTSNEKNTSSSASNAISTNSTDTSPLENNTANVSPTDDNSSPSQSSQSNPIIGQIIATIGEFRTANVSNTTPSHDHVINSGIDQISVAPLNESVKTNNIPQNTKNKPLRNDFFDTIAREASDNTPGESNIKGLNLNILIGNNDVLVNNENISYK